MPYTNGVVSVGTTATLIATTGPAPVLDGLRVAVITSSVTVYLGGSGVTTSTGLPVTSTSGVVTIPTTGAEDDSLYGIVSTGSASVAYLAIT